MSQAIEGVSKWYIAYLFEIKGVNGNGFAIINATEDLDTEPGLLTVIQKIKDHVRATEHQEIDKVVPIFWKRLSS